MTTVMLNSMVMVVTIMVMIRSMKTAATLVNVEMNRSKSTVVMMTMMTRMVMILTMMMMLMMLFGDDHDVAACHDCSDGNDISSLSWDHLICCFFCVFPTATNWSQFFISSSIFPRQ